MTAADAPLRARVDGDGHLAEADPDVAGLQLRAGGRIGGPVAVPQIAAFARLVRRLGAPVARAVIAADGDDDVDLWLRGRPDGDGVVLLVSGMVRRPPATPFADARADAAFDGIRADADWTWEVDAALRLRAIPAEGLHALGQAPGYPVVGEALTRLVVLEEAEGDGPPLLEALASGRGFDAQIVRARASGRRFRLAGDAVLDPAGCVRGFRGGAFAVDHRLDDPATTAAVADGAVTRRFDAALRRPLGRIVSAAEAIRAAQDGPVRADYAGYADDIASAGRHLLALVDDLVDLDAVERGDFDAIIEPVDMADLARRAAGLLAVRADEKRIRIARPDADDALPAVGDFRRSLQVLVNLIGNAVRYAPEDSGVSVSVEARVDRVVAIVADRGRGIAPVDHERAFDKFERLGAREPGTGLGLYISRRLARAMGGDVTIESGAGEGARFAFALPAE